MGNPNSKGSRASCTKKTSKQPSSKQSSLNLFIHESHIWKKMVGEKNRPKIHGPNF